MLWDRVTDLGLLYNAYMYEERWWCGVPLSRRCVPIWGLVHRTEQKILARPGKKRKRLPLEEVVRGRFFGCVCLNLTFEEKRSGLLSVLIEFF